MEPVEINAGSWYLRAMRADDRISDVPALAELGIDDPVRYVADAASGWANDSGFAWAVCEPTTGELLAVVEIAGEQLSGRARAGHDDALDAAFGPVTRFAEGALGLNVRSRPAE